MIVFTRWFSKDCFPAPRWAYLGRGLYLAWFMAVLLAEPPLLPAFSSQFDLVRQRLAFFALYLVACLACAVLWRKLSPLRTHRVSLVASSATGFVGVCIYLFVMWDLLPQQAMFAGFACAAVSLPLTDAGWGEAYSYLPLGSIATMLVASVTLCAVLVAVTPLAPVYVGAAILALQVIGSGALLMFVLDRSPYRSYRELQRPNRALSFQPSGRFLSSVLLLVCAASLLNGASERVGDRTYISLQGTLLGMVVSVAFLAGINGHLGKNLVRFLSYVGLFEAIAYLVFGFCDIVSPIGRTAGSLVLSCSACIGFIAWFVAIDTAQATKTSPFLACAVVQVSIAAGKTAAETVAVVDLSTSQLALVALALVAFGVFLASTSRRPDVVELPAENSLASRVQILADTCGLTPREHEVLMEWASGHNAAYVANALSISLSTAKTHIAHISQKTGTHGREELLRALDRIDTADGFPPTSDNRQSSTKK